MSHYFYLISFNMINFISISQICFIHLKSAVIISVKISGKCLICWALTLKTVPLMKVGQKHAIPDSCLVPPWGIRYTAAQIKALYEFVTWKGWEKDGIKVKCHFLTTAVWFCKDIVSRSFIHKEITIGMFQLSPQSRRPTFISAPIFYTLYTHCTRTTYRSGMAWREKSTAMKSNGNGDCLARLPYFQCAQCVQEKLQFLHANSACIVLRTTRGQGPIASNKIYQRIQ